MKEIYVDNTNDKEDDAEVDMGAITKNGSHLIYFTFNEELIEGDRYVFVIIIYKEDEIAINITPGEAATCPRGVPKHWHPQSSIRYAVGLRPLRHRSGGGRLGN